MVLLSQKCEQRRVLELPMDILIPAALENQSPRRTRIAQSQAVVELANGPTTPEADEILKSKEWNWCRMCWLMPAGSQ